MGFQPIYKCQFTSRVVVIWTLQSLLKLQTRIDLGQRSLNHLLYLLKHSDVSAPHLWSLFFEANTFVSISLCIQRAIWSTNVLVWRWSATNFLRKSIGTVTKVQGSWETKIDGCGAYVEGWDDSPCFEPLSACGILSGTWETKTKIPSHADFTPKRWFATYLILETWMSLNASPHLLTRMFGRMSVCQYNFPITQEKGSVALI